VTGLFVAIKKWCVWDAPYAHIGSLKYNAAGGGAYGSVAFGGDNLKIGYDNNGDDDIDDAGDDVIINESFSSTSRSVSYDHAGNLIDDGNFQYATMRGIGW
jgi:hypothetical protein